MALRMKPLRTNPELTRWLQESAAAFRAMPAGPEMEAMIHAQMESWSRQDKY